MQRAHFGLAAVLLFSSVALAQLRQQGPKLVGFTDTKVGQGNSVALSGDGNTAIVGAQQDCSGVGAAWVWTRTDGVWAQQGSKLVGSGAAGAAGQGTSVAISADGNTAIVGGPYDDDGGAAWVWTRSNGVWTQQGGKLADSGGTSVALSADGNTAIVGDSQDGMVGAAWIWTRTGEVWTQQGSKLVGSGVENWAGQGKSVALSADGNTAIVGGPYDSGGGRTAGAAWVFTRTGGVWAQQGSKLYGIGAVGDPHQGTSVALSADGSTAIVGGSGDNANAGAAWVFTRTGEVWTQQDGKLVGTGAVGAAFQGASVSLSADGNTAILAGPSDDSGAGAIWMWTRTGETWAQQSDKLVGSGAEGTAGQGHSAGLSADGNTAIVGGPGDRDVAGAAWTWTRSGEVWAQQGSKLVGSGAVGDAGQGTSAALSADGNTAIVGGEGDTFGRGAAWVWKRAGGVWTQQGAKLVGTGAVGLSNQGYSVSLSGDGNTAIVGGRDESTDAGVAWVWTRSGGLWTQQGEKLVGTGAEGSVTTGAPVALSEDGNTAIVGGYNANGFAGGAWVWTRSGGVWTQQGDMLVGSGSEGNIARQGASVALSADGNTAIVGGFYDAGGVGAAWVFTRTGGVWTQQGQKLVGGGAQGDASQGTSVAISADGNTAIVSGVSDDGGAGAAWVWTRSGGAWAQQGEKLVGAGTEGNAQQGWSVGISGDGNTAILGGPSDGVSDAGAAWVWKRTGGVWTQLGDKLIGSDVVGNAAYQGHSVALSADGKTAIVGGPGDARGVGGPGDRRGVGAAWVFAVGLSFYPLTPCRLLDTRYPDGPLGGPVLAANGSRLFTMTGTCGVPADARALSANVTVTEPAATGGLVLHPGDEATPTASTISFAAGYTRANNAILPMSGDGSGTVNVVNQSSGTVHLIVDVNGYFR
jgi:hypothetical protein